MIRGQNGYWERQDIYRGRGGGEREREQGGRCVPGRGGNGKYTMRKTISKYHLRDSWCSKPKEVWLRKSGWNFVYNVPLNALMPVLT